ncbi:MAG: dUTP diphosphatase [Bdellovibrionales bacterium]|nr:dUTP diphosphatase [Bdellovibrionales bacterium]
MDKLRGDDDKFDEDYEVLKLKVKTLDHFKGELPRYQSPLASGFDVRAQIDKEMVLKPGQRELIPTGLSFEIPFGFEIQARPRSGWAIKQGISLVNSPGTIDADYRGEVKIILINLGQEDVVIQDQDRIAQLVMCPVEQPQFELVSELSESERGEGGFGSTGMSGDSSMSDEAQEN